MTSSPSAGHRLPAAKNERNGGEGIGDRCWVHKCSLTLRRPVSMSCVTRSPGRPIRAPIVYLTANASRVAQREAIENGCSTRVGSRGQRTSPAL